jgi:environmental stress-induced protein Ves
MIRHLTPSDYKTMTWANGKGVTVEMLRVDENGLKWRLSRASVVENGDFSIFPGIERSLTVISGPGFELLGARLSLSAKPLIPIAFAGDTPLRAANVTAASDDFNVMTARHLPRPDVTVHPDGAHLPNGGTLAIFCLGPATVAGIIAAKYDLILTDQAIDLTGPAIAVRLFD